MRLASTYTWCLYVPVLVCCPVLVEGVTLALGSGSAARGGSVVLPLEFKSNGSQVSAVMWTLAFSRDQFSSAAVDAGGAAASSNKTVRCRDTEDGEITCIAFGFNATEIGDGQIASALFRISDTATGGSGGVGVTRTMAVSPDAEPLETSGSGGVVTFDAATVSGLSCSPESVRAPASSGCTVMLAAPVSRIVAVAIGYTSTHAAVSMPSDVMVPEGSTSANFTVNVEPVNEATSVQITASAAGVTKQFEMSVLPPLSVEVNAARRPSRAGRSR